MQLSVPKNLAATVLLSLAAVLPSAHAQTDVNTAEAPSDGAVVFPNDGTWPVWQDKSTSTSTSTTTTVAAPPDRSLGGAILNPFSQPAELPTAASSTPAPAPAAVATPPAPPESDATTSFTLMVIAAGAVLAGFALRRFNASQRRSA
ncbi:MULTISPECIES: hypothetical protein [unclassified Variovorax]|uniref:hypothetical protein n=1 Tax=unclassified Variovorax TaxID=663243 RepID=UPI00076CC792|nr:MULTISPECIES: hypothetical protein [unclassified Variovorax]KWT87603.1 hypothetical protein APY03_3676 [Variovorax sp. WDL1]PNG51743.1 hypothetical protein CHC06_04865 [Variovorax sp. B2]PNG54091.1 hypothetical protein CHC07_03915 [Variovorax sp. B4]VTV11563.1 hypothetical protein WDL1CHR_02432 [Variovorax sp. WDL1]